MAIPDSTRIIKTKVATQPFANLFNLINNRTNVPDPNDTTGIRKFVHVRMPHIGNNFHNTSGFPFIVVRNSKPSKLRSTVGLTKTFRAYDMMIEVYSQDKESDSSGNPSGAETRNDIVDSIISTIDDPTNRRTLIDQGMANLNYDMDIDDVDDVEGKITFTAEFDIRFENNLIST